MTVVHHRAWKFHRKTLNALCKIIATLVIGDNQRDKRISTPADTEGPATGKFEKFSNIKRSKSRKIHKYLTSNTCPPIWIAIQINPDVRFRFQASNSNHSQNKRNSFPGICVSWERLILSKCFSFFFFFFVRIERHWNLTNLELSFAILE